MDPFEETLNGSLEAILGKQGHLQKMDERVEFISEYELTCHLPFFEFEEGKAGFAVLNIDQTCLSRLWHKNIGMPLAKREMSREISMEIVNMVVGNATQALAEKGLQVTIGLPNAVQLKSRLVLSTVKRDLFHCYIYEELNFSVHVC
jgi:hypothetical protein